MGRAGVGLGLVLLVAAGCGPGDEDGDVPSRSLEVCARADATHPDGDQVVVQFRSGTAVIADGSIPVGGRFESAVPSGDKIDVYVADKLIGSVDPGENAAQMGCGELTG